MMRPGKAKGPSTSLGSGGVPPVIPPLIIGNVRRVVFADSPYTPISTDTTLLVDTTGGDVTIQLPAAAVLDDRILNIKMDIGTNDVIILPAGLETIDGAVNYTISILDESVSLQADDPDSKWVALFRYSKYRSNDYVEEWTSSNSNWNYDGDEDFALFPGYLAADVAANSTVAIFNPTAAAFTPFPRIPSGSFPIHFKHHIRSLAIAGVNTALANSYMLVDAGFVGDWIGLIWAFTDLLGENEYVLEIDTQKSGVPGVFLYNTGIPLSADRQDDIEFVIYPDCYYCYFNGFLIHFESGFTFTEIAYMDIGVQRLAANRQGLIGRTEIFTQAPNR